MSKQSDQDTKERRARIAQWQKEGADFQKGRKARNQALIHMGLATLDMIEKNEVTAEQVLKHTIENKVSLVEKTIAGEMQRRLSK